MFGTLQLYTLHCSFTHGCFMRSCLTQGCFIRSCSTHVRGPAQDSICIQEKALPGMISPDNSAAAGRPENNMSEKSRPPKHSSAKSTLASLPPRHLLRKVLASLLYWSSPSFSTFMKASFGISTLPTICIRFFPSFCFSRSFFLREMSPP